MLAQGFDSGHSTMATLEIRRDCWRRAGSHFPGNPGIFIHGVLYDVGSHLRNL